MAKAEQFPDIAETRPHGNRAHTRRKLSPMAYVELGPDNGGILLNLSEGGFAVQSALALTSREFSELRFQVPAFQGWLTASGRIAWISDSKKEAGIQFTELPGEARREIHKWVSAERAPESAKERIPAARSHVPTTSRPEGETRNQVPNAPSRDAEIARERTMGTSGPIQAKRQETGATPTAERQMAAVAEPTTQEFHFTDYSMFAAEPESEGVRQQRPVRHRGSWHRAAIGVLASVLFFALGATVGRESVDRWIAHLGGWAQGEIGTVPTPKVVPPPAPDNHAEATESKAENNREANGSDNEERAGTESGGNPSSEPDENSPEKSGNKAKGGTDAERSQPARDGLSRDAMAAAMSQPRTLHPGGAQRPAEGDLNRDVRGMDSGAGKMATEHAILVNTPEPGSRPFLVSLPGEAVSASSAVAISARRMLEIPPRSSGAASASQRVVIGKLIAHSEPFYPAEARKRGIEGSVELRARVGRTGEVIGVTPVSGPWLLFPAAVNAVREWRYEPTFVNGDPAETLADITIVFRLQ
jgi:TonB family protein